MESREQDLTNIASLLCVCVICAAAHTVFSIGIGPISLAHEINECFLDDTGPFSFVQKFEFDLLLLVYVS